MTVTIEKANPLWDGDGVQGAGQPRDRRGRWIHFPGPTSIARALIKQVGSRHHLIVEDNNRNQTIHSKHRSAKAANDAMSGLLRNDAAAYLQSKKDNENIRRRKGVASARREHMAAQQRIDEANARQVAEQNRAARSGVPTTGRAARKPGRVTHKVEESTTERLAAPGRPTQDQANKATAAARRDMPDNESKYAGLVVRLLKNKGLTQDPARRGDIHEKYGITPKRQVEIERAMYDHMFPQKSPNAARSPRLASGVDITSQQIKEMRRLGARKGTPEPDPKDVNKPSRYFKINKGPDRGKWAKVSWNGSSEIVTDKEATDAISRSKAEWTRRLLTSSEERAKKARAYRQAQSALRDKSTEDKDALKEFKIAQAQKWAEKEGLDPDDTYWHAFFWNDPSMLREQEGTTTSPMQVGLSQIMESEHMDPSILEGLLALPDISHQDMRGHRPGSKRSVKGDEDFVDASPESRADSATHAAANVDRRIKHDAKIKAAYTRYKRKHPNTKLSLAEFTDNQYNNKLRIPGGSRRGITKAIKLKCSKCGKTYFTDGEKHECKVSKRGFDPHEPRDFHGRWMRVGRLLGDLEQTRAHHGSTPRRTALKDKGAVKGAFNMRAKSIADGLKISRPQKGSSHNVVLGNGTPVKRRRHFAPETAYFMRNNGGTRISDDRLRTIYEDRSKITAQEHDLIMSAAGDARFDGEQLIPFRSVREGGAQRKMERYKMIKNLRTNLAQDFAKNKKMAAKGAGGQVLIHGAKDARAKAQRDKDNKKRAESKRNTVNRAVRQQNLDDFGDGKKAKCIFCKKNVNISESSPERMKPGPLGGKYERGNIAPAHVSCNEKAGHRAQRDPQNYYEEMMRRFLAVYKTEIKNGQLNFMFAKHRKLLGGKKP